MYYVRGLGTKQGIREDDSEEKDEGTSVRIKDAE